jgi:hypothetical protein
MILRLCIQILPLTLEEKNGEKMFKMMLIVLAASGCSIVLENPTQNPKIETLNPANAGMKTVPKSLK